MMAPTEQSLIPPPLDDDDDDVAWALSTAQVQWKRGSKADAVVWLRRAVDSAMNKGKVARAMQLNAFIARVEEHLVETVFSGSAPPPSPSSDSLIGIVPAPAQADVDALLGPRTQSAADIDALLGDAPAPAPRQSIDVEFEEPQPAAEEVGPTSQFVRSIIHPEPLPDAPREKASSLDELFPPEPVIHEAVRTQSTEPAKAPPRRVRPPPPPRRRSGSLKPSAALPPPTGVPAAKPPPPRPAERGKRPMARAESPPIHIPPPIAETTEPPPEQPSTLAPQESTTSPEPPPAFVSEPVQASEPVRSQPTSFPPESEAPRSSRRISSHAEPLAIGMAPEPVAIPSPAPLPAFPLESEPQHQPEAPPEPEPEPEPVRERVATRPPLPSYQPELPPPSDEPQSEAEPELDASGAARIGNVSLADVAGLQDLPPEAQLELVRKAHLEKLDVDEEVSSFAVALVIEGWASISPSIADVSCAFAQVGQVVFARGTLAEGVSLRVVAGETDTLVATWDEAALEAATADCPWVADELRVVADRFQALAGAAMGPLGERLDDALRQSVTDRCQVKTLLAGDVFVTQGKAVPGMFIVAAGSVEIVAGEAESASVEAELVPGDFVFANEVMSASPAPHDARAGKGGALLLFAERKIAHELMLSVPPLLEILSG